jgi:ABC-type polysaccharide/polyol phosphate transport system ATPase subunit
MFAALTDVSFEIDKGEAFGIIGRNGAGKSTLLKIIAGITRPSSGSIHVHGLVSSLIELGAGFHPDMTGRENVYMNGAILGISKKQIDAKFDAIVDFAELWDFIDVPVKKYSSGMYARLGFGVAVSIDPEVLIVDEILSVGDVFFQQKCFAKMKEIRNSGTTFVFVAHDTAAMQSLCDRALLLEGGRVQYIGSTTEAVNRYHAAASQRPMRVGAGIKAIPHLEKHATDGKTDREQIVRRSILRDKMVARHGTRSLEIIALRVADARDEDIMTVGVEHTLFFHILIHANDDIEHPRVGLNLYDRFGNLIFAAGTPQLNHLLPALRKGEELIVTLDLELCVGPGDYTFTLNASEPSSDQGMNTGFFHDVLEMLGPIHVLADDSKTYSFYGIAKLPMRITHERCGPK